MKFNILLSTDVYLLWCDKINVQHILDVLKGMGGRGRRHQKWFNKCRSNPTAQKVRRNKFKIGGHVFALKYWYSEGGSSVTGLTELSSSVMFRINESHMWVSETLTSQFWWNCSLKSLQWWISVSLLEISEVEHRPLWWTRKWNDYYWASIDHTACDTLVSSQRLIGLEPRKSRG